MSSTLRLVACGRGNHTSIEGPLARLQQTRELLNLIATKVHNDRIIASNATRDELTGLPNRLALSHRFDRVQAANDDCAMLFVDIDHFKHINDKYGHPAGDRVLSTVAERLRNTVRGDDFICRLGGDEFAVVLTAMHNRLSLDTVRQLAHRLVEVLSEPVEFGSISIPLSASIGASRVTHERDFDLLVGRADGAMYRAKRAGGGQLHLDLTPAA